MRGNALMPPLAGLGNGERPAPCRPAPGRTVQPDPQPCRHVLDRRAHGLGGCLGPYGPPVQVDGGLRDRGPRHGRVSGYRQGYTGREDRLGGEPEQRAYLLRRQLTHPVRYLVVSLNLHWNCLNGVHGPITSFPRQACPRPDNSDNATQAAPGRGRRQLLAGLWSSSGRSQGDLRLRRCDPGTSCCHVSGPMALPGSFRPGHHFSSVDGGEPMITRADVDKLLGTTAVGPSLLSVYLRVPRDPAQLRLRRLVRPGGPPDQRPRRRAHPTPLPRYGRRARAEPAGRRPGTADHRRARRHHPAAARRLPGQAPRTVRRQLRRRPAHPDPGQGTRPGRPGHRRLDGEARSAPGRRDPPGAAGRS